MKIRQPAVAGLFYPADSRALRAQIEGFLRSAKPAPGPPPKALVSPHAGYAYSGPVAASAYRALESVADRIRRVVMAGPSHRVGFRGIAYGEAERLHTPLGAVEVEHGAYAALADLPQVRRYEAPFEGEHCLEVQLPFLQMVLGRFSVVPLLVGEATSEEVAEVLERLWGGEETLILISSDLSHYLDYRSARERDAKTTRAIEGLLPEAISYDDACGRVPLAGLLRQARRHGLHAHTLDLRNSGDTAGPHHQVVGYGAYAFA